VNLNLNGDPQKNSFRKTRPFPGRPEDHFNMSLKTNPSADGEYDLVGVDVLRKHGNQNDDEILNVKVDIISSCQFYRIGE